MRGRPGTSHDGWPKSKGRAGHFRCMVPRCWTSRSGEEGAPLPFGPPDSPLRCAQWEPVAAPSHRAVAATMGRPAATAAWDALRLRGGRRRFPLSAIRGTPPRAHGDSVAPQSARQCQRGSCRGSKGHVAPDIRGGWRPRGRGACPRRPGGHCSGRASSPRRGRSPRVRPVMRGRHDWSLLTVEPGDRAVPGQFGAGVVGGHLGRGP